MNDKHLAVEVVGAGPAVLMIHGLGGTSNFYQVQTDALADRFQVIRIDSAGAGRSPVVENISIDGHADDAAAVLDELGIDDAIVVGHSMGTLIARSLANRHPAKVCKLVLLGAVAEPTDAGRQASRDRAAILRDKGTAAVAPGAVANALSDQTRDDRPEVAAFVRELIMRQDPEGYARNCEALARRHGSRPDLPRSSTAAGDGKCRPGRAFHGQPGVGASPLNAVVEIIDGIGHRTALEAASEVTAQLTKFL